MSFLQILTVRRLSMTPSTVIAVCLLLGWFVPHELQAQRILVRVGGKDAKLEVYNQLNNFFEGKLAAAKNRIESQVLDIDRVCEFLSGPQLEIWKMDFQENLDSLEGG